MFYAISAPYGITTMSLADRLVRFETRAERDAWTEDTWRGGRPVRGEITRDDARRWWPGAFATDDHDFDRDGDFWMERDDDGSQFWSGTPRGGSYKYL